MPPTLILPRTGQLPTTLTTLYTPAVACAVKVTLVNTGTGDVKVNLYVRLAAYTATATGERRVLPKDMVLKRRHKAEDTVILGEDDELLADATVASIVDFTISGVTQ
jgi:hypothetical protein